MNSGKFWRVYGEPMRQNVAVYIIAFGILGLISTLAFQGSEYLLRSLPLAWRMVIQVVVFALTAATLMSYSRGGKK